MYRDRSDIIRLENLTTLETKIRQIRSLHTEKSIQENEIIDLFVEALSAHGKDQNQIRQTSQISRILGESLGLGMKYCSRLEQAARIYDIGNIIICSDVYEKDEKLSFEEFEIVKEHTRAGYDILIAQNFLTTDIAAVISAEHHEWWNGGGYPRCLKEKQIDISAAIVAVADTVGALYRERPGRKAWEYKKILDYIKTRGKIQFNPDVVEVFLINQKIIEEVLRTDLEAIENKWYE